MFSAAVIPPPLVRNTAIQLGETRIQLNIVRTRSLGVWVSNTEGVRREENKGEEEVGSKGRDIWREVTGFSTALHVM
jgi:hypothetical protein